MKQKDAKGGGRPGESRTPLPTQYICDILLNMLFRYVICSSADPAMNLVNVISLELRLLVDTDLFSVADRIKGV